MLIQRWTSKVRTQSQTELQEEGPSEDPKILYGIRKHMVSHPFISYSVFLLLLLKTVKGNICTLLKVKQYKGTEGPKRW